MQNVEIRLTEIKKKLSLLPGDKLGEVEDFVGFLLSRYEGKWKKNIQMKGVWAGKGFERMDITKEIKGLRKDLSESILKKNL